MSADLFKSNVDELFAKIKLRNQAAFAELYDKTNSRLYGLILKIIPDEQLALDVLQECYQKIWLQADQFRADLGSAWSWICQLARNLAIDHYRKHKSRREISDIDNERLPEPFSLDSAQFWPEQVDLGRCLKDIEQQRQSAGLLAKAIRCAVGQHARQ